MVAAPRLPDKSCNTPRRGWHTKSQSSRSYHRPAAEPQIRFPIAREQRSLESIVIAGTTGQGGAYLAALPLGNGATRPSTPEGSTSTTTSTSPMSASNSITATSPTAQPDPDLPGGAADGIYNLAAQCHVQVNFRACRIHRQCRRHRRLALSAPRTACESTRPRPRGCSTKSRRFRSRKRRRLSALALCGRQVLCSWIRLKLALYKFHRGAHRYNRWRFAPCSGVVPPVQ
jgi:hypothetical protein